ncbi:putative disease resistance RPP13-like protein 1 [Sesamum angolense]|uniref:Disease resistance RPP13-like protein 1 n=1 Tax=Sesamum angolense TaxID=2727404 RepID=A0AAE2C685_9LAMI|nr:putative disease resistance RPP13-like protein 1 [Sesamum angolense]
MSVFAVLERLAPFVEKEVNLVLNSKQDIQSLYSNLKQIQEVLQDAERRGVTDISVKTWLEKLQEWSYEVDDMLDEWETKILQQQIQKLEENDEVNHATLGEKVCHLVQSFYTRFQHVVDRRSTALETKELNERLDLILEEKEKFNFHASGSENLGGSKRVESTSFVDESCVYGRNSDKDNLLGKLLSEGEEIGTKIVSLVGPGGLGKTTLAQSLYNDSKTKEYFELRSWIYVSDPFDERRIAITILGDEETADSGRLQMLLQRVLNHVSGKKFLIVLDDVWTEDYSKWEPLKSCLKGLPGSRILVTTRSERVARVMGSHEIQLLGYLSDADYWSILSGIAFAGRGKVEREKLEGVGIKIAMKCKGLPLAARSMGSMLSFRNSLREWEYVLESPLWKLEEVAEEVFRVLNLSYCDLSPVLKRCFSCCAIYRKHVSIHMRKLFRIWLAHGYLSSKEPVDEVYLKGLKNFENLAMRSFFQVVRRDNHDESNIIFKIHDIVQDFANFISESEYCFIMDGRQHSSHQTENDLSLENIRKVRSFSARYISGDVLASYLIHLKRARLLSLVSCNLKELPQEIGELIHLSSSSRSSQTNKSKASPNVYHPELGELPQGFSELTGLWTLAGFKVGRGASKLGYLQNLNQLQGSLYLVLRDMDDDNDLVEAQKAELENKIHIRQLVLLFAGNVRIDVMDVLQQPPNLQRLRLLGYNCHRFPNWITSLNYLRVLDIRKCENCSSLPALGKLPMLEKLTVYSMGDLKCIGIEFLGIGDNIGASQEIAPSSSSSKETKFPKLKELSFQQCSAWEEWEDISEDMEDIVCIMPSLYAIQIIECPKLKALPHRLLHLTSSLQFLTIRKSELLLERYMKGSGDDWHIIAHVHNVETE